MSTPPLLLAAAILLWGWQTGLWWLAVPLAALAEAPRVVAWRGRFSEASYRRVADFSTAVALVAAVLLYVFFGNPAAIKLWFQWLPVVLLPLALMQGFGAERQLDLAVFFWSLRRSPPLQPVRFNVAYVWFGIWLLGASAAHAHAAWFYAATVPLALWALLAVRPAARLPLWLALVALALALGYAGQLGLHRVQLWLEAELPELLLGSGTRTDPVERRTDLGRLGDLKGSAEIVLRVSAPTQGRAPLLLHRASYDEFRGRAWVAGAPAFEALAPSSAGTWDLAPPRAGARITIHEQSAHAGPVLSLPAGTYRVAGLDAAELRRNSYGAVQADAPPGRLRYEVAFGGDAAHEAPPGRGDLELPRSEAALLHDTVRRLGIERRDEAQVAAALKAYFAEHFRYALFQSQRPIEGTPLADFLVRSRAGHCEYFASATVLLLRAAGIPARYATGFSMQEYSEREQAFVVRQRHAHAWARAWIGGAWRDLDTTPPSWFEAEAAGDTVWTRIADLGSWALFRAQAMYAALDRSGRVALWGAAALLLLAWLAWRIFGTRAGTAPPRAAPAGGPVERVPSALYGVERRIAALGYPRGRAESLGEWIERLAAAPPVGFDAQAARACLRLHYRGRFGPPQGRAEALRELDGRAAGLIASLDAHTARRGISDAVRTESRRAGAGS